MNPALDTVYTIEKLKSGKTYLDTPFDQIPAGKGLNVARVIRSLGEEVTVTGLLPESDRKKFISFLENSGIHHQFFSIPGGARINTTLLESSTGESIHLVAQSQKLSSRIEHEFSAFIAQYLKSGDFWCLSGSIPQGFPETTYSSLIHRLEEAGAESALDTRGVALKHGMRSRPMVIKPNLNELEEFFGEHIEGVHHIALKGKRLLDGGVRYVFISLGEDGMIALHKNDCLLCNAPSVQVRDTTGCGDALLAGVLVALKRQFSFTETCRMAVACGSAKAMQKGPGNIDSTRVWQLMEDVTITSV